MPIPSATHLVQQVRHVSMVMKNGLHMPGTLDWIDTCLMEVDDSLKVSFFFAFYLFACIFH